MTFLTFIFNGTVEEFWHLFTIYFLEVSIIYRGRMENGIFLALCDCSGNAALNKWYNVTCEGRLLLIGYEDRRQCPQKSHFSISFSSNLMFLGNGLQNSFISISRILEKIWGRYNFVETLNYHLVFVDIVSFEIFYNFGPNRMMM